MTLKEQLIHEIEQTSDALLEEFLDFILFAKARRQSQPQAFIPALTETLWSDPLTEFIGAVQHGDLAQGIDATLYE